MTPLTKNLEMMTLPTTMQKTQTPKSLLRKRLMMPKQR